MKVPTVKIEVIDGTAYVKYVPAGLAVEITDFDVHPESPERDEEGRPCSRYTVSGPSLVTQPPSSEGINPLAEWIPKWRNTALASAAAEVERS